MLCLSLIYLDNNNWYKYNSCLKIIIFNLKQFIIYCKIDGGAGLKQT